MKLKIYSSVLSLTILLSSLNTALKAQSATNLTGVFSHEWTADNGWLMEDSLSFVYDQNGKKTEMVEYYGDSPFTGVWTSYSKVLYSYNNNGDVATMIYLTDNSGTPDTSNKETYTYDGNHKQTLVLSQSYNNGWKNTIQYFNDYDGNGNLIAEYYKTWDSINSTWISNFTKITYTYDGNNHLTDKTTVNWDNINSVYKNLSKYIYTNSGNGKPLLTLHQMWNGVNAWYDLDKDSSIYDGNNKLIENYHRYRHQGGADHWGMQYKETHTYTSSGKINTYLSQYWDTTLLVFTNKDGGMITSSYDNNDNITQVVSQNWDTLNSNWGHIGLETKYYYSTANSNAVQNISANNNMKTYPNPFINAVSIEIPESLSNASVSIYDLTGREIVKQNTSVAEGNKLTINTENFLPGVYLLQFNNGGTQSVQKITKLN